MDIYEDKKQEEKKSKIFHLVSSITALPPTGL